MARNPLKDGNLSENSFGIGAVTRKMVLRRAEELATINGDWLHKVKAGSKRACNELKDGFPQARQWVSDKIAP